MLLYMPFKPDVPAEEIRVTNRDVFALRRSRFDAFLFADVGTEPNGSTLTMLSLLARLDNDPWAEAARWAVAPKGAAVDWLTSLISSAPLEPQSQAGARTTATRLVSLLPSRTVNAAGPPAGALKASARPWWLPMTIGAMVLMIGLAASMVFNSGTKSAPHTADSMAATTTG